MLFISKPTIESMYDRTRLTVDIDNRWRDQVETAWNNIDDLEADYTVKVEKTKTKRSLDANAYAWALISKLAKKLHTTNIEVYRRIIADTGAYTVIPIKEAHLNAWRNIWSAKGLGWICEDIGACKNTIGYVNTVCFHGSSAYDTKEMSHFIDLVIQECKQQGIETLTPQEIEQLKKEWGGENA